MNNNLQKLLPLYHDEERSEIKDCSGYNLVHSERELVVQAANAYPRLVDNLKTLTEFALDVIRGESPVNCIYAIAEANKLLTELGENDE
jgi:hypothetical protein